MYNITITDRDDGFGAQFQHIIFGIIYAEMNNKTYIHKPITKMAHNYENNPNFISEIEEFINIKNHYKTINNTVDVQVVDFWTLYNFMTADENLQPSRQRFNNCLNKTNAIEKIKTIFWENKTNPYHNTTTEETTQKNTINVAVHIRRPNNQDDRIEGADTPDEYYLNVMNQIQKEYQGEEINPIFHIFSQNTLDRTKYTSEDIILHIDEDIKSTFISLVAADILVGSKSALSYCAGLLTNGKVYFLPFTSTLNPLKNSWIITV
jgi:hypothetical protein